MGKYDGLPGTGLMLPYANTKKNKGADFELCTYVDKEQIQLRLYRHTNGLIVEREIAEANGDQIVQVLPALSLQDFADFMEADPRYEQLKYHYRQCLSFVTAHLASCEI